MFYIYIIECEDNSLYTGIAKDIIKRLKEHYFKLKNCAKYTKTHQMKNLKALWSANTKSDASKLEYHIKNLTKENKLKLINNPLYFNKLFDNKIDIKNYKNYQNEFISNIIDNVKKQ